MVRIQPGDLVRIQGPGKFFYALILDKITLFGGQLTYAFHLTSGEPLDVEVVLSSQSTGFYEIVDFIWAKRESRIERIGKKLDVSSLNAGVKFFKSTYATTGKAKQWGIYDRKGEEIKRVATLSAVEKGYPLYHRIDDVLLLNLIEKRWTPDQDARI